MFDARFETSGECPATALPPRRAPSALAVAARLGIFVLAAFLGVLLLSLILAGVTSLPDAEPGRLLAIGGALVLLLSGGVLLDPAARRSRSSVVLYVLGLFATVLGALLVEGLLTLALTSLDAMLDFFSIATLAGAIGLVVAYLLSGLRVAPPPYQRYVRDSLPWKGRSL